MLPFTKNRDQPQNRQVCLTTPTKGNVASAGLTLDEWRPLFNERHTGDNQSTKNTAFARARKELVDKGLLKCSDDIYRLGDKAT